MGTGAFFLTDSVIQVIPRGHREPGGQRLVASRSVLPRWKPFFSLRSPKIRVWGAGEVDYNPAAPSKGPFLPTSFFSFLIVLLAKRMVVLCGIGIQGLDVIVDGSHFL